jgi:DNA-binding NarL/FixJ family response regulator
LVELRRIGTRCHSLSQTLHRLSADNSLLIDKLISVQEAERREVAHELRDEFAPALLRLLRKQTPRLGVIVFSMYEDVPFVTSAMEAGARGYVTKNDDPERAKLKLGSAAALIRHAVEKTRSEPP